MMINKHDFKAALEWIETSEEWIGDSDKEVVRYYLRSKDAVKAALRLADRLQSGDVSAKQVDAAIDAPPNNGSFRFELECNFKAMAAQLMRECKDGGE